MSADPRQSVPALVARSCDFDDRVAIRAGGVDHTYAELRARSEAIAAALLDGRDDLAEARVAFLAPIGFEYFAIQWAIWRAGGTAVPLSIAAAPPELEHVLTDSGARAVVATRATRERIEDVCRSNGASLLVFEEIDASAVAPLPVIPEDRKAMILYTSGTTNRPKGVVSTHGSIRAQIETLVEAWQWNRDDRIPLFLPLHHIHGIINVACCALWCGARIETHAKFDAPVIFERIAADAYTVFMAVPTIYVTMIAALESDDLPADRREEILRGFSRLRLMVSGSAALPPSIHEKWAALTGQRLLERYGMTETGMLISNPYIGERRQGAVGHPLPGVQVRLKAENGEIVPAEGEPGEIQVRGPMVFQGYWNQPDATAASFDDGWFCTGDLGVLEDGYYRILGRLSVDIIKSGGYKISALEIEAALIEHPAIRECAIVGIADEKWGEIIAIAAALESGQEDLRLEELHRWSRDRLSPYKLPRRMLVLDRLPRNGMGKVQKKVLSSLLAEKGP